MTIAVDSSPLICLAKIGRLDLLRRLYEEIIIPDEVYEEVVGEGKRLHKAGVETVEDGIGSGWIKPVTLNRTESRLAERLRARSLGKGEAAVLALAKNRRLRVVLDDRHARESASVLELEYLGSAAILLDAFRRKYLSKREFLKGLEHLGSVMWLSPEIISRLTELAEDADP